MDPLKRLCGFVSVTEAAGAVCFSRWRLFSPLHLIRASRAVICLSAVRLDEHYSQTSNVCDRRSKAAATEYLCFGCLTHSRWDIENQKNFVEKLSEEWSYNRTVLNVTSKGTFWFSSLLFVTTVGHWAHMIWAKRKRRMIEEAAASTCHAFTSPRPTRDNAVGNHSVGQALNCLATCVNSPSCGRKRG